MDIIDEGHKYLVDSYDGGEPQEIWFMKRIGKKYPFNEGPHPGTNCQELIRVLIDRVVYLNRQQPHSNNLAILSNLRNALWLFEDRAAERHGFAPAGFDYTPDQIEDEPTCVNCGHLMCKGHPELNQLTLGFEDFGDRCLGTDGPH